MPSNGSTKQDSGIASMSCQTILSLSLYVMLAYCFTDAAAIKTLIMPLPTVFYF